MDANYNRFQERLRRIDGAAPLPAGARRRRSRRRIGLPWRSLVLAITCCFLLKGVMIWHQGAADYAARLAVLEDQGGGHRVAAWLLSIDPVSGWIGSTLNATIGPPPM